MKQLNDKQEAFCQNYCNNGFNASQAYKAVYHAKAGWDKLSSRLMGNDGIKQRIAEIKAKKAAEEVNSRDLVTKNMFMAAQLCLDKGDMTGYIRIMENLGKNCGWFAEDNAQQAEQSQLTEAQLKDVEEFKDWKRVKYLKVI